MSDKYPNYNWLYIAWFFFYLIFFSVITGGIALIFYAVSVPFAFSPIAEKLWRVTSGVRPLRLKSEKIRLIPLFKEVYIRVVKIHGNKISRGIKLYIQESMDINAYAFGKGTLVLTLGSVQLLNDECLKGLIAHELGHFENGDTQRNLLMTVGNFFMSLLMKLADNLRNGLVKASEGSFVVGCVRGIYDFFYTILRGIRFLGDLILMPVSRQNEYMADGFANRCGFGEELAEVLNEIYGVSISSPKTIKEMIKATHPPITKRIEHLEKYLD